MLGLKLPTDPRWVNIVETDISEILTDHAWCEQKAATNAITIIVRHPEFPDMVDELSKIVLEEMQHFIMVHEMIKSRGLVLGMERKDEYVNELMNYSNKGGSRTQRLVDRLLFSALIEARSCERFKLLSEELKDEKLKTFYRELMISEAGHFTTFIGFARKYAQGIDVDKKWEEFLKFEAEVISNYGKKQSIHG